MSKGELVLIPFPFTDLSGQKVRPALVLHKSKRSDDYIVAFVSSINPKARSSFEVPIKASKSNGLKVDSMVRVNKIATLDKKIVLGELGRLEKESFDTVKIKLRQLLGL